MCGLCTKYKRLPLLTPLRLQRGFSLGLRLSHCQLPLTAGQIASQGGASEVGAKPSSTTAGYATVMRPLPGPASQQLGSRDRLSPLTPDPTGVQRAADLLPSLHAGYFQDRRGPGSPVHTRSYTRLPRSYFYKQQRQGKEAGPDGGEGMLGEKEWERWPWHQAPDGRPRNDTLRAALAGPTQMTHFCC